MDTSVAGNDATRVDPFVELHFYQGGLRTEHFPSATRPAWAPSPDRVGFRDEIALSGNDIIIEVVKFANKKDIVSWIAVYRHCPDEIYGDRGQHRGIGLWLCNLAPKNPNLMIEALQSLLHIPLSDIGARSIKMLNGYVSDWITKYTQLPPPLGGLSPSDGLAFSSALFVTSESGKKLELAVERAFQQIFYFDNSSEMRSRALILITSPSVSAAASARGFTELGTQPLTGAILGSLPTTFEGLQFKTHDLERRLQIEQGLCQDRELKIGVLNSEIFNAKQEIVDKNQEIARINDLISSNSEINRHSQVINEVRDLKQKVSNSASDLFRLRQDVGSIQADVRKILSAQGRLQSAGYGAVQFQDSPHRDNLEKTKINHRGKFLEWIFWAVIVILSIALAVVVYRLFFSGSLN